MRFSHQRENELIPFKLRAIKKIETNLKERKKKKKKGSLDSNLTTKNPKLNRKEAPRAFINLRLESDAVRMILHSVVNVPIKVNQTLYGNGFICAKLRRINR